MFCEKCGAKIKDEHIFCVACGARRPVQQAVKPESFVAEKTTAPQFNESRAESAATEHTATVEPTVKIPPEPAKTVYKPATVQYEPVSEPAQPVYAREKAKPEKRKMSGAKLALIIVAAVLGVAIITAGVLTVVYFTSSEQQIVRAMDNADYETALSIYNENFDGDSTALLERSMLSRLESVKQDFIDEKIEFEVAKMEISTIAEMNIVNISDELEQTSLYIWNLNDSRTAFGTAESLYAEGDYAGAIENYKKVVEDDVNYEAAKSNLEVAIEKLREEALSAAAEYADEGLFEKAMTELESAIAVIPEDEALTEQLEVYKADYSDQLKEKALVQAEGYAENKEYDKSLVTVRDAIANVGEDVKLTSALDTYTNAYVDAVIKSVDALVKSKDFTKAVSALNDALEVLPDNEDLTDKLAEVEENKPVSLSSLTPINGGWTWNDGDPTDPFGVTYSDVGNFAIIEGNRNGEEYYAEYRLYGEYKTLTGSMISHSDITETGHSQVKIYADNKLVYTSPSIERKTDLLDFSVDISGADYIKVVVFAANEESFWSDMKINCLILMDCQLWK